MPENELITFLGVFVGGVLAGLAAYLKKPAEQKAAANAGQNLVSSIDIEFGNREQIERWIAIHARICAALEILADKRTTEISDIHQELLDRLGRQDEELRTNRVATIRRNRQRKG